jgi:hypothetical protein
MEENLSRTHSMDEETNRKLLNALHGLATQMRAATPPDDLEARLLARAEGEKLFAAPVAVTAAPRRDLGGRRLSRFAWPRWAWAPVAAAALAFVLWTGAQLWQGSGADAPSLPQQAAATPAPTAPPGNAPSAASPAVQTQLPREPEIPVQRKPARRHPVARPATPVTLASLQPPGSTATAAAPSVSPSVADSPAPTDEFAYSAFVPLSTAPELRMDEFAQTVRVRVEREDLWRFGLPVPATRPSTRGGTDGRVLADFLVGEDGRPRAIRLVSNAQE